MNQILIILPTYNEAGNILRMLDTLFARMGDYRLNVLVVDDNSPDGTGQIVEKKMHSESNLHLLKGRKEGLGKAYMRGFEYGLNNLDPDIIVMMDSDFSHNPDTIPSMVAEIDKGADYVIGSRYTSGGAIPGDWPLLRIINSRVANAVAKSLGGILGVKDISGGFKALRASKLKTVDWKRIGTTGYAFQMHLLHTFMADQAVVREVPITFADRTEGTSKLRKSDVLEFIQVAYGLDANSPARQMTRFVAVGLSGIAVNLGILVILAHTTALSLILASAIAIEISILTNFLLHNRFTFSPGQQSQSFFSKLFTFNAASLGTAALSLATFTLLHSVLGMFYLLAQFIGILAAFALNYQISSRVIWKKPQV